MGLMCFIPNELNPTIVCLTPGRMRGYFAVRGWTTSEVRLPDPLSVEEGASRCALFY